MARCKAAIEAKEPTAEALAKFSEILASQVNDESDIDDIFGGLSYLGIGKEKDLPETLKYVEALRAAYKKEFGEAEKGRYVCPVDKEAVDLCARVVEGELGEKLPEFKIMLDDRMPFPYHTDEGICVPQFSDTIGLVHSISSIMPILIKKDGKEGIMDIGYFIRNRNECFRKMCWETGSQSRMMEKSIAACSAELLGSRRDKAKQFAKDYVRNILSKNPSFEAIMDPITLMTVGLENVAEHHVYYSISYPVGWICVRKLDSERFRALAKGEEPWKDPAFGWNGSFSKEESSYIGRIVGIQKKRVSKTVAEPAIGEALKKAYDDWERLWLGEQ
jgi:hypothetical protein